MSVRAAIGGVFAAEPAAAPRPDSIWDVWRADFQHQAVFANARSALAALLTPREARRVWLPAYVCGAVVEAAAAARANSCHYGVSQRLEPDLAALERDLAAGDAVVIVDYFGRPPGEGWRDLIARRPEVLFIEDRAQALDPGEASLADAVIYSPRKLLGVADGGMLFARTPTPAPSEPADDALWAPQDARADDPDGLAAETWRPLFTAIEDAMRPSAAAATARTLEALKSTALAPIAAARRANWRQLAAALGPWALWPEATPGFAPLAFPILTADPKLAVAALASARIWAPRHWERLPSDPSAFPDAHRLAGACVSLPLDQRYDASDMKRIIETVAARVPRYPR
jgi:dTDP-4-amino-4,6-dideoxygalactose transaminase